MKSVWAKLFFKNWKNKAFNVLYREPKGQIESLEKILKGTLSRIKNSNKQFHVAGDFKLNIFDHEI